MRIEELRPEDYPAYTDLARSHGSIFNYPDWLEIYGDHLNRYGIYDDGNQLVGGFHLYKQTRCKIPVGLNPPFCPVIGPFYKVSAVKEVYRNDFNKKIASLMADFMGHQKWALTHLALSPNLKDMQPFIWKKYKIGLHYTYLISLENQTEEQILKGMSDDRRNDIKKALRDGLQADPIIDYDLMFQLVRQTYSRQNKSIPAEILKKILFQFARPENSFGFVTTQQSASLAAAFCIYDQQNAYYLLGGYTRETRHHGAGPLAVWECIKKARSLGLSTFDLEGSMIQPIERYFRGFGGQLVSYYTINKAWFPLEIALKLSKRELF